MKVSIKREAAILENKRCVGCVIVLSLPLQIECDSEYACPISEDRLHMGTVH